MQYKKVFLFIFTLLILSKVYGIGGQNKRLLSEKAEVSIVTLGPDVFELYATFGHTLIRVQDLENNIDWVYNFGVFDFNQPNFYLNFARGYLLYKSGRYNTQDAINFYHHNKQNISSIKLNLLQNEKQAIFDALENYLLPENTYYYYDYFFNNCSTKVRDVFEEVLKKEGVTIDYDYSLLPNKENTIGEMVRSFAVNLPWGSLGIDMCLGATMDKVLTKREYSFLPEYLEKTWMTATLDNPKRKLTDRREVVYNKISTKVDRGLLTPLTVGWVLFFIVLVVTVFDFKMKKQTRVLDFVLFGTVGLLGILLTSIWFFTNHTAARNNLDVIWALPMHVYTAFLIVKNKYNPINKYYLMFFTIIYVMLLLSWGFLPQYLDRAFIPIVLTMIVRIVYFLFRNEKMTR